MSIIGEDPPGRPAPAAPAPSGGIGHLSLDDFVRAFADYFSYGADQIDAMSRLREDLMFDSLEMLEVTMLLDEMAATSVPTELIESISTVADVHHWVCVYASRNDS